MGYLLKNVDIYIQKLTLKYKKLHNILTCPFLVCNCSFCPFIEFKKWGLEFWSVFWSRYEYQHNFKFQLGYGHFGPGEFARRLASNTQADWVFVQWKIMFSKNIF